MVGDGAVAAKPHRQSDLAAGGVRLDVPHVVDVEHSGRQQATGGGRQQQVPLQAMGEQVVGAEHPQQAEEQEYRDVPEPPITIRSLAHRVGDGRDDGRAPQQDERQDLLPGLPEGADQQGEPAHHGRQRGQSHGHAHLVPGDEAGDHGALGPDPLPVVGTGDRITIVIGQVGEDLQQDGGQQGETHDGAVEGPPAGCEPRAQQNGGARQRQCSQTRRQQPNREGICHIVMAKQSDIDRVKGYRTGFRYTWPLGR
ncbi:hypothetical protein D3C85_708480 [compost metagenome]